MSLFSNNPMKNQSIILSIIKWLLFIALVFFLAMNYWSSLLIEEDIKTLKNEIHSIKNQRFISTPNSPKLNDEKEINSKYPNLLSEDPFYTDTLPKLLPDNFIPHGTLNLATYGKPEFLHPFPKFIDVHTWNTMCLTPIANLKFGQYESFKPALATRVELRSDDDGRPEFWIFLRKDVFWAPLKQEFFDKSIKLSEHFLKPHPVTAHDIKFNYDAFMNHKIQENHAIAKRLFFNDLEELRVIDDYTLVARWATREVDDEKGNKVRKMKYLATQLTLSLTPLASFIYKYFPDGSKIIDDSGNPDIYRTNPVWAQNFMQHWAKNIIASCGEWTFDGFNDKYIRFKRTSDYFNPLANLIDEQETTFTNTADSIWDRFKTGQIDYFLILPHQRSELERFLTTKTYKDQEKDGSAIKQLEYVNRAYSYLGWNQKKIFFKSKKVRQALTMAVDRQRIIDNLLYGMGVPMTGPFFPLSKANDSSLEPYPFDVKKSKQMLAEEGWYDSDGDGIIDKEIDGKIVPFEFHLTYFVKNPTSKTISEFVATGLKEIGIKCHLKGLDVADLSATMDDRSFDAIFMGWAIGTPPEDPKQLWYSKDMNEKGSSNYVGFSNAEADNIIEKLEFEDDPEKRIELYHRFHKIIYDEQPYTFMYTSKNNLVYREYLQNVFIPIHRQDLVPNADVAEPQTSIYWIKE